MIDMSVGFSLLAFKHKRVESIWTRRPGNIKDAFDCDLAVGESEGEIFHKKNRARLPNWLEVTYGSVECFNAVVNAVQNKCTIVHFLLQKLLGKEIQYRNGLPISLVSALYIHIYGAFKYR